MTIQNDNEAYILAKQYNLSPPRKVYPERTRRLDHGKYEADGTPLAETRSMVLANWFDKTNIIIQYKPAELPTPE
jgi:hypothetical protein